MPSALVLLNPRARAGPRAPIARILDAFQRAGWQAELWSGTGIDWTTSAARRGVAAGFDAIFGAGGDGFLADILPAILGTPIALGVVPLGTGNVWARELGLPLDPGRAILAQLAQPPRQVDVGLANGRPFLVIASVGFDARIVELVEASAKPLGQIAYPLMGVSLAGVLRGVATRVWIDDEAPLDLELLACIITNGRLYGGLVPLAVDAQIDDGYLDCVLFAGSGSVEAAVHAARVLAGTHVSDPNVRLRRMRKLRLETLGESLPIQTDGDPRGSTPLDVEVLPSALLAYGVPARA